ncbi:hypothetical protein QYF36_012434 [Acer negundo]|nr:hypothetical protein QYF36_012434 [Acer negundo]
MWSVDSKGSQKIQIPASNKFQIQLLFVSKHKIDFVWIPLLSRWPQLHLMKPPKYAVTVTEISRLQTLICIMSIALGI